MKKNYNNNFAFTLIELIVVITILTILWTIAFISLQWYSSQARDSKRLSDISNIKKSLELFSLKTWKYPLADEYFTVSYSWEQARHQWKIWDQVSTNLSKNLNEKPIDPLTWTEYYYSTTHNQTEYEVLWLYETDLFSVLTPLFRLKERLWFFNQSNASSLNFPKIEGNYNWIYVKTSNFYVPTPSIINWNIWWSFDFIDDENLIESQVITGWDNIPWISTWWLDITLSVYTWWTLTSNSTVQEKINLVSAIQTAYSWSVLANNTPYADFLSKTSTWEIVEFVDVIVLKIAEYSILANGEWSNPELTIDWNIDKACFWANYSDIVYESTNSSDDSWISCEHDIAVCTWNWTWYIISSCNIWATSTDVNNTDSYWMYFQWWRNDWFHYDLWDFPPKTAVLYPESTFISWWIDLSLNTTYSGTYIYASSTYQYNWLSKNWESSDPSWGQWPCPNWYHIPTKDEWVWIFNVWWWWSNWDNISNALKIPYAWIRSRNHGALATDWYNAQYWSSTPSFNSALCIIFRSDYVNLDGNSYRAQWHPIRCFKD